MHVSWDDLIDFIDSGKVLTVVGRELLRSTVDGQEMTCEHYVAKRLATELKVQPQGPTISDAISAYPGFQDQPDFFAPKLNRIIKSGAFPIPESVRALARIRGLRTFVSTTCDDLLVRALNDVRFGGTPRTLVEYFAPNHAEDLPKAFLEPDAVGVYHLLGRAQVAPDFAMTEGDMLEFFHALHREKQERLKQLVATFRSSHLLMLGTGFPDWITRIFLRFAKDQDLAGKRNVREIVADEAIRHERGFATFIDHFSTKTEVYDEGDAIAFVHALANEWEKRYPPAVPAGNDAAAAPSIGAPSAAAVPPRDIDPAGSIFISYAREDYDAARSIYEGLTAQGLDVWLDKERLKPGAEFSYQIERFLTRCAIVIPLISHTSAGRGASYYRREWNQAVHREEEYFGLEQKLIHPVIIDDIAPTSEGIPVQFRRKEIKRAPGGRLEARDLADFVDIIRTIRAKQAART